MKSAVRLMLVTLVVALASTACHREKAEDSFSFIVYPGARYLPQLTELTKQAHRIIQPAETEVPPIAIYDSEASVDEIANFYVKSYGYSGIASSDAPDASGQKPLAYRRTGDLAADFAAIAPLVPKLNVHPDASKAVGKYDAIEIAAKPNRPRVTIQRPYFDGTTSQVVNRTIILMSR